MVSPLLQSTTNKRGMILFFALLILGVTATSVVLLLSQSSVSGYLSVDEKIKSEQVRAELFGCFNEVLVHFAANADYVSETVNLGTFSCTSVIQSNGNERTVTLTRVNQGITRRMTSILDVSVLPITVSSILEQ